MGRIYVKVGLIRLQVSRENIFQSNMKDYVWEGAVNEYSMLCGWPGLLLPEKKPHNSAFRIHYERPADYQRNHKGIDHQYICHEWKHICVFLSERNLHTLYLSPAIEKKSICGLFYWELNFDADR